MRTLVVTGVAALSFLTACGSPELPLEADHPLTKLTPTVTLPAGVPTDSADGQQLLDFSLDLFAQGFPAQPLHDKAIADLVGSAPSVEGYRVIAQFRGYLAVFDRERTAPVADTVADRSIEKYRLVALYKDGKPAQNFEKAPSNVTQTPALSDVMSWLITDGQLTLPQG